VTDPAGHRVQTRKTLRAAGDDSGDRRAYRGRMSITFDIGELEQELAVLRAHPHTHTIAFVLPLVEGRREVARALIEEEPPFDIDALGLARHEVLLTDNEAVFVFETRGELTTLESILSEEDFWLLVRSWEKIAAGKPRIAEIAYSWRSLTP
jgi:hypothetical protein